MSRIGRKGIMETQLKKIDATKREISVEVSGDTVKNKFEEVFERINKEAKVAGFRPGHVPRDILEKRFSSAAHEQVLKELIPQAYAQAIEKEGLQVLEYPKISEVKLDRSLLSFKATVEVSPEIALKDYKGLKLKFKKVQVTPDEIKRRIDALKESRKADAVDDKFAKGLGYADLPELETALERDIYIQKENEERGRRESGILEGITGGLDFKLPQSLVERQLQDSLKHAKIELGLRGVPKEKIEEQEKELIKSLEPEARKQVKVYLVLSEIAKKENIAQDDNMPRRVMELLLKEADWQEAS